MSIKIEHLTKKFGEQKAVDDISFQVNPGEILGFLGPNGAGKSTTMKITTGYLPPTSGKVTVAEHDVTQFPLQVKRMIGYLPEHNPLYMDMYVHEYLRFVGKLHKLRASALRHRVNEIIGLCGLGKEQNKKIEALSKGYRQRVGLAQALIHDPEVLILDEPTTGLDPNQIVEIRQLIRHVSKDKTVIFSSHIMQEVQQLCDRVVVINNGRIVADEVMSELKQKTGSEKIIIAEFDQELETDQLLVLDGVNRVVKEKNNMYRLYTDPKIDVRAKIFNLAAEKKLSLIGLRQEETSMEQIFQELTRKSDDQSS
ncbi:MAG: gliding motility-associated ABC transporter ATP-binding subunit GldA [Candidatus Cyclobacteriaceae bacterium M2_1C_046]